MARVTLEIRLLHDEDEVHYFTRGTTNDSAEGVQKLCGEAMAWGQLLQSAVNEQQWRNDVRRVQRDREQIEAQRLLDETELAP